MQQAARGPAAGDGGLPGMREKRLPRRAREVQNKAPAPLQITAEQILREANEMEFEKEAAPPRQQITDPQELEAYKLRKRKEFENILRRQRLSIGVWLKYAKWEETQKEFKRARSIFERLLGIDYQNHSIWLRYAEMEMRNKFVDRARNVWDRAVQLLPRVDQLWYKYAYMEEQLRNFEGARRIFERWMKFSPGEKAWMSYVSLEMRSAGARSDKLNRCRIIYQRFVKAHSSLESYLKFAQWEKRNGFISNARKIYESAMSELDDEEIEPSFYTEFARLEIEAKEMDRARTIYKYALDNVPRYKAGELFDEYMAFEKQHGDKGSIDTVIVNKRRFEYEQELKTNPHNYDIWFDYIKLEEQNASVAHIREVFERAVANHPPIAEKRYWKRYIYLWIKYFIFEELTSKDVKRCRNVYDCCLQLIPHQSFTFGKIWLLFAKFELRQCNLDKARHILGQALGRCPKRNIFNGYIQIEFQLGEFDRCRKLYTKFLETFPENCNAWVQYAALETKLDETERARAIYELGIKQETLDTPEVLWRSYIDFEIEHTNDSANVRSLFERLLEKSKHVKVWISFAQFESSIEEPHKARQIFIRANDYFRNADKSESDTIVEERVLLLEAWEQFEQEWGSPEQIDDVRKKQPKRIKRKRPIRTEDGMEAGWEEYYDYVFPDEIHKTGHLKLLERARAWKKRKLNTGQAVPSSVE